MQKNMREATSKIFLVLFLTMPFLSGCWDRLEMEQRATVLALAIDLGDQKAANPSLRPKGGNIALRRPVHLTAQIAVPGRIPLGPGDVQGGGGSGGGSSKLPVWVLSADGSTLNDAVQQLQQKVADKLFFGHLRVIVVSQTFARKGLDNLTDYIRRNPEIRRTAWVTVATGKAYSLMEKAPPLERVPALYLLATMDQASQLGKMPHDFLGIFESKLSMKGREPVLPFGSVKGKENVYISGLAYFKGDKMVGSTSTFDIASYMELSGEAHGGYPVMLQIPGFNDTVVWQAYRRKRRIKLEIRNGRPYFTVMIHIDGNITEKSSNQVNIDTPQMIKNINQEVEMELKHNIESLIKQTKQKGSDIVGFGEYVRAKEPAYWNRYIETKEKWEQMYPSIPIGIRVQVRTHRVGMSSK